MSYHVGDFALETTVYLKFTTVTTTGAPTQLAGSPVVSVYENDDNTQITAGVTLNVDEDGVTGLNQLVIAATAANGYEAGKFYTAVITTGTVGGTSVVGYCVGSFTIQATSALKPTTAGRTLDVASTGEAGIDFGNILLPAGAVPAVGIIDNGTAQAAAAGTITLRAAAAFGDNTLAGATVLAFGSTQGYWQTAVIASNVGATDVATLTANWPVTPTGTITYIVIGTPPGSSVAVDLVDGAITSSTFAAGAINAAAIATDAIDADAMADGAITAGTFAAGAITATVIATDAIDADAIADNAINAGAIATGAITAAKFAASAIDAAALAADAVTEIQSGLALSTQVDALEAAVIAIEADTQDIQARLPAALTAQGNIKADSLRIVGQNLSVGGSAPASPIGVAP